MADSLERRVVRNLKNALSFLSSRRSIPMFKGTLAYILAYIFIFLRDFDELSLVPQTFFSIMIVVIAIQPGTSVGACIESTALAVSGLSLGCLGFLILAKLSPWPVAQAFVFAFLLYTMALVRAQGMRWFNFSLFCILQSFNGIFTSYQLGGVFSPKQLVAFYVSYLWAAAIALGVNVIVLPYTAQRELRRMLVTSLEHVATFSYLLAKEYTFEITEEERALQDHLDETIRTDFRILSQKIEETSFEISFSRHSLKSYKSFVWRTRALQQALITAHSNLIGVEKHDQALFKERFLPSTVICFTHLRRAVDLTIRSIGKELQSDPMKIPATQSYYVDYMSSMEAQSHGLPEELATQLALTSERHAAEVAASALPSVSLVGTMHEMHTRSSGGNSSASFQHAKRGTDLRIDIEFGVQRLRMDFDTYAGTQHKLLQDALLSGHLAGATDEQLRVCQARASLQDTYGHAHGGFEGDNLPLPKDRRGTGGNTEKEPGEKQSTRMSERLEEEEKVLESGHSLIRVWGFVFALDQFVSELEAFWLNIRPGGVQPKKRLHVYFFEALRGLHRPRTRREDDRDELPLPEALALLENRPYKPDKRNKWEYLESFVRLLQGPTSIFAAKNAAATSLFAVMIYATASRQWFINYVLSPGIMTIVVALEPTLGQSMVSFILQVAGSGIGYLWALAVLEMFRDVGGYKFNPFGIICMVIPFALIMQYIIYNKRGLFVLALLAMNGLGVVISAEWVAVEYLQLPTFDSPAFLVAKGLTALAIAVAIAAVFQLLILRNPARRTLRKRMADLVFSTLSYTVLLQAFGRTILTSETEDRPSKSALIRVERGLRRREFILQRDLINLIPLLSFAAAEPQFTRPFKKDTVVTLIQSNQMVLDRLREARAALGSHHFEEFILTDFAKILVPYRTRHRRAIKTLLYMMASSLQSKAPLPQDTPLRTLTDSDRADFIHDVLVLSSRFAKTEHGSAVVQSREFVRYVAYLFAWSALFEPLKGMEDASKQLLGELEKKLL